MERKAFLDQEPPPGYVAGVGRGATGFVTSADTGAVKNAGFEPLDDENEGGEDEGQLSLRGLNGKDDEEADNVYEEIEKRLQRRSKKQEVAQTESEPKEIENQFNDLKRALVNVSDDQWANLPEAADLTRRNKRIKLFEQLTQRTYATPDNIMASIGGTGFSKGGNSDIEAISEAKERILGSQLDSLIPKNPDSQQEASELIVEDVDADDRIADIQKNRAILLSLRKTEPNKPNSWIASANLEVQAKKYGAAKRIISEGCRRIPKSPQVWLESIKIHRNTNEGTRLCKVIVTEALRYNSTSVELWLVACDLENSSDVVAQRRVLMKGIEFNPNDFKLWKRLIAIQDSEEDQKKLLTKVVEIIPHEWAFWNHLIQLSEYSEAKSLLNRARKELSSNPNVWITALKLEENNNNAVETSKLSKMLEKGLKQLKLDGAEPISRQQWLDDATVAEKDGLLKTCKAIVDNTIDIDIPLDQDDLLVYISEATHYILLGSSMTANYIYHHAINKYPHDIDTWMKLFLAFRLSKLTSFEDIASYYSKAIRLNPAEEIFYLMYAKDQWLMNNDVAGSRETLLDALDHLPESEDIWYARVKLELKNHNYDQAEAYSKLMLEKIPTVSPRVWYKHIHLQRFMHKVIKPIPDYKQHILSLIERGLQNFPESDKLYLQKGQTLLDDLEDNEGARTAFNEGTIKIPNSVTLWIHLARIEESKFNVIIRARSIMDKAIFKNPKSDKLWEEKIKLERRNNDLIAARQLTNKALKSFKNSPLIWIQYLSLIPKMNHKKNAFLDCLKSTDNSPLILLNIGILFWIDTKIPKAKAWFERALLSDDTNGDIWSWYYNFTKHIGVEEDVQKFEQLFLQKYEDINKGEMWNSIAKEVKHLNTPPLQILQLVSQSLDTKEI